LRGQVDVALPVADTLAGTTVWTVTTEPSLLFLWCFLCLWWCLCLCVGFAAAEPPRTRKAAATSAASVHALLRLPQLIGGDATTQGGMSPLSDGWGRDREISSPEC
jgi:hypothetical protein